MTNTHPICVLCAMRSEADALIPRLGLVPSDTPWPSYLPPQLWRSDKYERKLLLVTNGHDPRTGSELIGTTPATLATQLITKHLQPSAIIVAGAAGGCSETTRIGQVLMIRRAFHHDRRIPLPEFADYAHGPEPLAFDEELAESLGIELGDISTGNALDTPEIDLAFFRSNGVSVKDMETAAISWTAGLSSIPVMALRSITDHYDHPAPESQFLENFGLALNELASTIENGLPSIMDYFGMKAEYGTLES